MKKSIINFNDFERVDIRVGKVIDASRLERSTNLIKMIVDLGEDYGVVQIVSGISKYYQPEELIGNNYPFIANLTSKKVMGEESRGMLLVLDVPERFFLITLDKDLKPGTIIR